MSGNGSGGDQSEDGELQSPTFDKQKQEALDFRLVSILVVF